jgi:predicted Zn-dependent protease with MMP-like domain
MSEISSNYADIMGGAYILYPTSAETAAAVRSVVPTSAEMHAECCREILRLLPHAEIMPTERLWRAYWLAEDGPTFHRNKLYSLTAIGSDEMDFKRLSVRAVDAVRARFLKLARDYGARIAEFASNQMLDSITIRHSPNASLVHHVARWGEHEYVVLQDEGSEQLVIRTRAMFVVMPKGEEWVPRDE